MLLICKGGAFAGKVQAKAQAFGRDAVELLLFFRGTAANLSFSMHNQALPDAVSHAA